MNDNDIKEMLHNLGYGENPPDMLMNIVREFRRRKCAVFPCALTMEDVVCATIFYDFAVARGKGSEKQRS